MTAMPLPLTPGTPLPAEPAAPTILHLDAAEIAAAVGETHRARPMPHPEDAMELQLLQAAKDCAAGTTQIPRRELVAVALREAERQQWWRDQAEAESVALKRELATLESAHALQVQELRQQRRGLTQLLFEMIAWASHVLGCEPSGRAVIAEIRKKGSGLLRHDVDGGLIDRVRTEVANG